MRIEQMALSTLVKAEVNVRIHTEKQLREFKRSIQKFGQIRPIVVDENRVILCGNGLYEALVSLGYETADVCVYDNLSQADKRKLMIADNKIYSLGIDDVGALDAILHELGDDLDIPGYDEDLLHAMMATAEEVNDLIANYGTLQQDDIDKIKAQGERRDEEAKQDVPSQNQSAPAVEPARTAIPDQAQATERRCIICPKCGEEIWL